MEYSKSDTDSKTNSNQDYKTKNAGENGLEKLSRDSGKRLGNVAAGFAHSTTEYVKSGREYVSENPVSGVAIAAAAGAVVGSILTMSMRRRH